MSEEQKRNNKPEESAGPGNSDKKGKRVYLSHDGLFRVFFDKKNVAESFIKENLPVEITRDLDFSALTLSKDTFVDKKKPGQARNRKKTDKQAQRSFTFEFKKRKRSLTFSIFKISPGITIM